MSTAGYILGVGDEDYNFGYNDFTVEFFTECSGFDSTQTLFEITNNESPAANLFVKNRFLTLIENGNLTVYGITTNWPVLVPGGQQSFNIPATSSANLKIFYGGQLLSNNQYSLNSGNVTLSNVNINSTPTLVEAGDAFLSFYGNPVEKDKVYFISTERKNNKFYLFLDGKSQGDPQPLFASIPAQYIVNSANLSQQISRVGSPALLTIGANKDGQDKFTGFFGDFRITNGVARHVYESTITNSISSQFTDIYLGTRAQDIDIVGGSFVDSMSSYSPEELIPGEIYDVLNISVYQNSNCANLSSNIANIQALTTNVANPNFNASNTILGFRIVKDTITLGPVSTYNFNVGNVSSGVFKVPFSTVYPDEVSITMNGNLLPAYTWSINNYEINLSNVVANSNISILLTGDTNYYSIGKTGIANLTANLYSTDSIISVSNTAGFITPNVAANTRGIVYINGERISYLYIDRFHNVLSGLMRGTNGTGVPSIHVINSQVISASNDRIIPGNPGLISWYNLSNTNLAASNSSISSFLVSQGTAPPA